MNSLPKLIIQSLKPSLQNLKWKTDGYKILFQTGKQTFTPEEKQVMKVLMLQGTPTEMRKQLWLLSSGSLKVMNLNKNYYKNLVQLSLQIPCEYSSQIDIDLKRTFHEEYINGDDFIVKLKTVLTCYSIRNSSVGYCQGFNFIAGRLMKTIVDEEETFWTFCQLIEDILPLNYYSELIGVITDTTMINIFMKQYMPDLNQFFVNNSFEASVNNFIHKWLVGLFIQNFESETSFLIWDFLFLEGNIVVIKTCLAIFCILKRSIMSNSNTFEDIFSILNEGTKDIKNKNCLPLLHALALRQYEFDEEYIIRLRSMLQVPIIENFKKERLSKEQIINNNQIKDTHKKVNTCNPEWPICVKMINDNADNLEALQFLVLQVKYRQMRIDDYFFSYVNTKNNSIDAATNQDEEDILLERKPHTCEESIEYSHFIIPEEETGSIIFNEGITQEENKDADEEKEVNVMYDRLSKGEHYIQAKHMIMSTFNPKPFQDVESEFNGE